MLHIHSSTNEIKPAWFICLFQFLRRANIYIVPAPARRLDTLLAIIIQPTVVYLLFFSHGKAGFLSHFTVHLILPGRSEEIDISYQIYRGHYNSALTNRTSPW